MNPKMTRLADQRSTHPHKAVMEVHPKQCCCQSRRIGEMLLHELLDYALCFWAGLFIEPDLKLSLGASQEAQKSQGSKKKGAGLCHVSSLSKPCGSDELHNANRQLMQAHIYRCFNYEEACSFPCKPPSSSYSYYCKLVSFLLPLLIIPKV